MQKWIGWLWPVALLACADATESDVNSADAGCVPCEVGTRQCGPGGGVLVCADLDGDGCPEWGAEAACPAGGACVQGACVALCEHACAPGEAVCGAGGRRVCGDENGDGCRELGAAVPCGDGERCDDGVCVDEARQCEPACARADLRECADDTGYRRCGQFDEDACLDWSVTIPCGPGTACMGEGECVPTCADECEAGATRCDGDGFATCGNHDADPCLEFGAPIACGANERCDDGACVPEAMACEDACGEAGGTVCAEGTNGFQRCGQYDADPCLELSEVVPCAGFEACEGGECVANCMDDCEIGGRRCGEAGPEMCGNFDADPCLEFGPPMPCGDDERCDDGRCVDVVIPCEDACESGALRCADGGVQICADQDDDPCVEWGAAVPCGAGERCEGDGVCVADCEDACAQGEVRCEGDGVVTCGNFDADACLEFGPAVACPEGQSCSEGACRIDCVDDCAADATDCVAEGLRRCGQFDADACRDWSSPTPCGPREACEAGACVPVCVDECADGDRRCLGEGFEICGDFDDDPCLEFGGGAACGAGAVCADGVCEIDCDDECVVGATQCADAGNRQTCGNYDPDPCTEWGALEPCDANELCQGADCALRPAPAVVINEILYDVDGGDAPGVFTELYGPPGTALDGLILQGYNGANGQIYNRIELAGVLPADGLWVVAHTQANAALAAVADQLDSNADYQNGADAIQLRWGDQIVDAVAYGNTEGGEGSPAPDVPAGQSLSRDAAHTDTDDNNADFTAGAPSPGGALACEDACAADAVRCAEAVAERCEQGGQGCLAWRVVEDCAAAGAQCVDGACQLAQGCTVPEGPGALVELDGLAANFSTIDAAPWGDGWLVAAGAPSQSMMRAAFITADGAMAHGPHSLGTTSLAPWGNNAGAVYYPSVVGAEGQYAVTWSGFNGQGNRDIYFRRLSADGELIARNQPAIAPNRKGFSPQVRVGADGFVVLYNAYREIMRVDLDFLGNQAPVEGVSTIHGDSRDKTFLAWVDTPGRGLLAYAVNSEDFRNPRLYLQALDDAGVASGPRIDMGVMPHVTPRYPNVHLFDLGDERYGLFWREILDNPNRTETIKYAVINRAGVIERQVDVAELDRPQLYKPWAWPESIAFDGERFAIYQRRYFDGQEPLHWVMQWMTVDGVHIARHEYEDMGPAKVEWHPTTATWWLFKAGETVSATTLGCD